MSEIAETSDFAAGADTYVPSIDGPLSGSESTDQSASADDATEQSLERPSEEETTEQQATGEEQPSYSKDPVLNQLIQQFAKDHPELDPANTGHLKILSQLANKEKYIRDLKSKSQQSDGLTDFERALQKPGEVKPEAAKPAETQQPRADAAVDDIGSKWTRPEDAYTQLAEAWKNGDLATVNKVELGILQRRATALGFMTGDQAREMIRRELQQSVGDVLPRVRETVAAQQDLENREFVLDQLEAVPDWKGVRELDKEIDGEALEFAGEKFRNTRLNQILTKHPEILDINVRHPNPVMASRLTYAARYRAAMRNAKEGQIDAKKASQFVKAGTDMADKESRDRARKGMNSGSGATGLSAGKKTGSVVRGMIDEDGPSSFSSL